MTDDTSRPRLLLAGGVFGLASYIISLVIGSIDLMQVGRSLTPEQRMMRWNALSVDLLLFVMAFVVLYILVAFSAHARLRRLPTPRLILVAGVTGMGATILLRAAGMLLGGGSDFEPPILLEILGAAAAIWVVTLGAIRLVEPRKRKP